MIIRSLLLALLSVSAIPARAESRGNPTSPPQPSPRRAPAGFALKKTTSGPKRTLEQWERAADGALLTLEILPQADESVVEARLKKVNANIPSQGVPSEELMFRYQTTPDTKAWTNYRATHHATFKTYRFWKLQNGRLAMADVSFPHRKPDFDAARGAFIAAKKAADGAL